MIGVFQNYQLVDLIREIHDNQILDIRGALHGRGNFERQIPASTSLYVIPPGFQ